MQPHIIHEEKEFVILAKPAGMLMHSVRTAQPSARNSDEPTLAAWVRTHYPETKKVGDDPEVRPGIVHRLDKDTSGVLLISRTQVFFEMAKTLFANREMKKTYLALARGHVERERNIIARPLSMRAGTVKRTVRSGKMRKDAVTEYHVLQRVVRDANAIEDPSFKSTFLEVMPHTGRTHQIRVHLTAIGHPILGDALYGPTQKPAWIPRLMLHALSLQFIMPDGRNFHFRAAPDKKFVEALREAGTEITPVIHSILGKT
jgi:23S rRNA pseudouridine1911/1915/1917 synthase